MGKNNACVRLQPGLFHPYLLLSKLPGDCDENANGYALIPGQLICDEAASAATNVMYLKATLVHANTVTLKQCSSKEDFITPRYQYNVRLNLYQMKISKNSQKHSIEDTPIII